jgi:hypothetical protein
LSFSGAALSEKTKGGDAKKNKTKGGDGSTKCFASNVTRFTALLFVRWV